MRKEVILAVITGIILGGVILYGINLANNSSKATSEEEQPRETTITPTVTNGNKLEITFVTPQNHAVVTEDQITLKGISKPNSNIAIISENDDIITTSDNEGNFSSPINLLTGENTITVTVVDPQQATFSSTISVIHTSSLPE